MNLPTKPAFGRDACKHTVKNHPDGPMVFDDWIDMNVQSGSQWDGFRHFGHQTQGRFYNDLTPEEVKSGMYCPTIYQRELYHMKRITDAVRVPLRYSCRIRSRYSWSWGSPRLLQLEMR